MMAIVLIAAQAPAASLRIGVADDSEAIMQVIDDRRTGYRLKVDCVARCVHPLHFTTPISGAPMGLVDLDADGLIYSTWGTGCCYMVRVWKITPGGVAKVLETGSRYVPSLITTPDLKVVTYIRPTDSKGRETSTVPRPIKWTYRDGRFERS